jgi:hypothetical protein
MSWASIEAGNTKVYQTRMQKHTSTMQHSISSRETTTTTKVQQETYAMRLEGCKPKRRQLTTRKFI